MGNTLLGGGTPEAPSPEQEARMERLPGEVDGLLRGISDEELKQALARRLGTTDVYETCMYHHELAPRGKNTTSDKIEELEAEGWVDTPAKFNTQEEDLKDGQRDEGLHELPGQGGHEAQGSDPDPEGTSLHDLSEDGRGREVGRGSEDAGQGSRLRSEPDKEELGVLSDDEIDEKAKAERKENVYAAFAALIEEADDAKFDKNGQPHLDPLNDLLGFAEDDPIKVKTIERNRRWEVYRENLKKEANKAD